MTSTPAELRTEDKATRAHIALTLKFIEGRPHREVAHAMGISPPELYKLCNSPEYQQQHNELRERLGGIASNFLDGVERHVKSLMPLALTRVEEILESSVNERVVLSAAQDVLDRGGIARQTKVEQKHVISLDPKSLEMLLKVDQELAQMSTIELESTDWSYIRERPTIARGPSLGAHGPDQGTFQEAGHGEHILHGEGSHRFQGLTPRPSWDDGSLDAEPITGEIGISPT